MADTMIGTEEPTYEERLEAIGYANVTAKRAPCVVEKFTDSPPSAWTRAHQVINEMLDEMGAARG